MTLAEGGMGLRNQIMPVLGISFTFPAGERRDALSVDDTKSSGTGTIPSAVRSAGCFTVNIPDSKGGYTPVILKRVQGGFTGPRGNFIQNSRQLNT